eukprot:6181669-Pleurochrysis_carterae.AAC.2
MHVCLFARHYPHFASELTAQDLNCEGGAYGWAELARPAAERAQQGDGSILLDEYIKSLKSLPAFQDDECRCGARFGLDAGIHCELAEQGQRETRFRSRSDVVASLDLIQMPPFRVASLSNQLRVLGTSES